MLYTVFDKFWSIVEKNDAKVHARQVLPEGIVEENNFEYLPDGNHYHLLDAYYPAKNNGSLPVIIDIHGGGWMYADKELNKIYCEYIASRGFLVFNLSYRLVPDVTVREQLYDVSAALLWIKENLHRFPADETKIMLTGDSAGGQLAAFTAAIATSDRLKEHFGVVDHGMKFNCVALTSPVSYMNAPSLIGSYGRMMWKEKPFSKCVKPFMNLDEVVELATAYPPTFMVTSSGDILGLKQTRQAYALFMKKGIAAELLEFPKFEGKDLPHVFGVLEPESKAGRIYINRMCEFFRKYF